MVKQTFKINTGKKSSDTTDTADTDEVDSTDDMNKDSETSEDETDDTAPAKSSINKDDLKSAMKEIDEEKQYSYIMEGKTVPQLEKICEMCKERIKQMQDGKAPSGVDKSSHAPVDSY